MSASVTPQAALAQIKQVLDQATQQCDALVAAGLAYTPPPPPPPPVPPLDVFSWWTPKAGKAVKTTFVRALPDGRLAAYFIKNVAGWPWDIQLADSAGVYFRVTERSDKINGISVGWPSGGDPRYFRLYTQSNPSGSFGFQITPRFYDPSQGRIQVASVPDVPTSWYAPTGAPALHHLGPAQSFISLVKAFAFGGDLGTQDTLIAEYYYTVNTQSPLTFKTRERFYLTAESGWVWWDQSAVQADGTWKVVNQSYPNTFIADDAQVPVFPTNLVL